MEIYLDYIFLENLIVSVFIIFESAKIVKIKASKITLVILSVLDSILGVLHYTLYLKESYPHYSLYIVYILLKSILLFILFKPKNVIKYLKSVVIYYLVYFLFFGIVICCSCIFSINLEIESVKLILYIVCGGLLHIILSTFWKMFKSKIRHDDLMYVLKIENERIPVFVDTGNSVKASNRHLNVVFLDRGLECKLCKSDAKKKVNFAFETVSGLDYKTAYEFDNVEVYKEDEYVSSVDKMMISFELNSYSNEYSGIVGYDTYLEDFKGVHL